MIKFLSVDEVAEYVEKNRINFIDLRYTDLIGRWHHITIPTQRNFPSWAFYNGVAFDSSSTPGFEKVERGDLILKPDMESGFVDTLMDEKALCFFANITSSSGEYSKDPRTLLTRAIRFLRKTGIADDYFILPELEFYLLRSAFFGADSLRAEFELDTVRYDNVSMTGGYELVPPFDADFDIRTEIVKTLLELGIQVKYHHQEGGVYGQNELELAFAPAMTIADAIVLSKYVVRMVAIRNNMVATFMPKPIYHAHGSGLHMHQYLVRDGKNIFYDEDNELHLSKDALYFIGGILVHMSSLMAFTNPTTNSYKRLNPSFEAPTKVCFGVGNRTATIRIPIYDDAPDTKRFELRTPDGMINPYLAISAMLMAGLDGIMNRLDPISLGFGPLNDNAENLDHLPSLPLTFDDALMALQDDNKYLLIDNVFSPELIESWIELKKKEISKVSVFPNPAEFELYFNL